MSKDLVPTSKPQSSQETQTPTVSTPLPPAPAPTPANSNVLPLHQRPQR